MSKKRVISFVTVLALLMSLIIVPTAHAAPSVIASIRPIETPVAGHFPSSVYKYPYLPNRYGSGVANQNGFDQTLTWSPAIDKTFLPNTVYTATLLLEPNSNWSAAGFPGGTNRSFSANNVTPDQIGGLPADAVLDWSYSGANLIMNFKFPATGPFDVMPEVVFYEDFSKGINYTDKTIGEGYFMFAQEANRQGLGNWRDNMTSVRTRADGSSELVLAYQRVGNTSSNLYTRNNFITAGGVRTRGKPTSQGGAYNDSQIIYEHSFGYYEASIKFPAANVVWGAFWLFCPATAAAKNIADGRSIYATEIDIIETAGFMSKSYNAAYHAYNSSADRANNTSAPRRDYNRNLLYNGDPGYSGASRLSGEAEEVSIITDYDETGIDLYDGQFHKIALEWSPTDYIFYVDGIEIGSWKDLGSHYVDLDVPYSDWNTIYQNEGVMQNPAYIKLTVEAADWADESWDDDWALDPTNPWRTNSDMAGARGVYPEYEEMVVEYVKILNGPKPGEISINGDESVVTGAGATANYTISAKDMPMTHAIDLEFEVDGDFLGAKSATALEGFEFFSTGNYGSPFFWKQVGNTWIAKAILMNADGIEGDFDIVDLEFNVPEGKLGVTDVKINAIEVSSGGKPVNAVIDKGVATTVLEQWYSRYDLTKDGVIDLNDLTYALQFLGVKDGDPDWDQAKLCNFDDTDDEITIGDLILILNNYTVPYYS